MPATNQRDKLSGKTGVSSNKNKNQSSINILCVSLQKGGAVIKVIGEIFAANLVSCLGSLNLFTSVSHVYSYFDWQISFSAHSAQKISHSVFSGILSYNLSHYYLVK
jgi:hypothetical protein